jgi:hypothetical protein
LGRKCQKGKKKKTEIMWKKTEERGKEMHTLKDNSKEKG